MKFRYALSAAVVLLCSVGCGSSAQALSVSDAWMRITGDNAAMYMNIGNSTNVDDTVTSVNVAPGVAEMAMLHKTSGVDTPDARTSMEALETVDIPAHRTTKFEPLSTHVMLSGVKPQSIGSHVRAVVVFAHSPSQSVDVEVRA